MFKVLIKVSNTNNQTRISIPKLIAEETGLDKALMVVIESFDDKSIKIKEWGNVPSKETDIQND